MSGWHWSVIAFLSLLVPADRRVEWRREWKGELLHLEQRLRARPNAGSPQWRLFLRSLGAVSDASYLCLTSGMSWRPHWDRLTFIQAATQRAILLSMFFLPISWVESLSGILRVDDFFVVFGIAAAQVGLAHLVDRTFFKRLGQSLSGRP